METYLYRPVFPLNLDLQADQQASIYDDSPVQIGLNGPSTLPAQSFAKHRVKLTATNLPAATREDVEEWLSAVGMTARSLWLPCDLGEATIIAIEDAGAYTVRIAGQDWSTNLGLTAGMFLRLLSPSGESTHVKVLSVEAAGTDEMVSLDDWPVGLTAGWHVSRLILARLTKLSWTHQSEGLSDIDLTALELPLEYDNPSAADDLVRSDVWLYTLTRRTTASDVLAWRMTSAPDAVLHEGNVYSPAQIDHDKIGTSTEGDTDALTVRMGVWPQNPFLAWFPRHAAGSYGFIVERVRVDRSTASSVGTAVRLFRGEVASVTRKGPLLTISCKSPLAFSTARLPGFMFQTFCNYALYDKNTCGVDEAAYKLTGNVAALDVDAATVDFECAALAARDATWLLRGYISILLTSGELETRFVRSAVALTTTRHRLTLNMPTAEALAGAAATASPGCDKSVGMCQARFANRNRFGGHPFLPSYNPSVAAIKPPSNSGGGKK